MKSHERTLLQVVVTLIIEGNHMCSTNQSEDKRDVAYVTSRVEEEGLSFLTITLPTFAESLEKALDKGFVGASDFRAFRKSGAIPSFLKGMLAQIFESDNGILLTGPSTECIRCIRSICYCMKKLRIPCSKERVKCAIDGFVEDERDLAAYNPECLERTLQYVSDTLWSHLQGLDYGSMIPKHGPGATFEKISGNQKYNFKDWPLEVDKLLPMFPNVFTSVDAFDTHEYNSLDQRSLEQELPVRVITVPKTLKSPRLIAIEPVAKQYAQQALSQMLISHLESFRFTEGHVNFRDQSVNQKLAIKSSFDGLMATLDLTAASDRVPMNALRLMFQTAPLFVEHIEAFRTKKALLPNGDVIPLSKFASMGSALCFPIESMYFYTICVAAQMVTRGLPFTARSVFMASRDVYVYGDDIVVPVNSVESTIQLLHDNMCKVNSRKSYWTGKFRESCGTDAYDGKQVNPVYLRTLPPNGRKDASEVVSWIATANLFAAAGFYSTASKCFAVVETFSGKLPTVTRDSSILGRHIENYPSNRMSYSYYSKKMFSLVLRGWSALPVYRNDKLTEYAALLKCLLLLEQRPRNADPGSSDPKHLRRSARHHAVQLRRIESLVSLS